MKKLLLILGILMIAFVVFLSIPSDPIPEANQPSSLVLYSIDGRMGPDDDPPRDEEFHGYPVWGKVDIKDASLRQEIIAEIENGIRLGGPVANCFWPRHGISIMENGKQIDIVICFECLQAKIHKGGESETEPISETGKVYFNELLTKHGLELVPAGKSR